jgi:O-antigen ligase
LRRVRDHLRTAVAPLYLLACLVLGGSAQGVWQNMVLQLAGLAIIAWAALGRSEEPVARAGRPVVYLAIALIAVVALQLIPLPPSLWAHGSRAAIAEGYRLLGKPVLMLPISLTPAESLSALFCLIPPIAIYCAMTRLRAYHPSWIAAALLAGTVGGVLLGAVQVASPTAGSAWYPYPESNFGSAVGFFANSNHMADLLVVSLPFVAAIAAAGRNRNIQGYSALIAVLVGLGVVLLVGIALNGSLAGYGLALPAIAASALIVLPTSSRWRAAIAALSTLALAGALVALVTTSIGATKVGTDATGSVQSRKDILRTTGKAIADNLPFGTGLGSFVKVYRLYESPDSVTPEYVIHAHNDYAEVALELGVAGIVLMLLFLAWWAGAVAAVWRTSGAGPFSRAASIASATVLAHSIVDFPLRTAAISVSFAAFCALLADRRAPIAQDASDLRPTRHVVIG